MILVAAVFLMACGGQSSSDQSDQTTATEETVTETGPMVLSLAEFQEKAENIVGKEVALEGNVIHVCKHGGKKMFITADDPDVRIKITTGEEMAAFDTELEGSYVKVRGIVEEMMVEVEAEEAEEGEADGEVEGEHEEDADHSNYYHKPQYSVSCLAYSVKEIVQEG